MPKTHRLVYCEFSSSKLEEELAYYTELIGARLVHRTEDSVCYLSLGLDHHNVVLRPGDTNGLLVSGFQLSAKINLDQLSQDFASAHLEAELKENARPGISKLLEVKVAGHRFQFFTQMEMPAPGFSTSGIAPSLLGHIALITPEADALVSFFRDTLGFFLTDSFDGLATFLTCNYDHHVMNIIGAPITKLHHIAFELRGGAHQYLASDQLAKAQYPILWGPSRHTAGHNYASYHFDPDRTLIELYTDMDIYLPDGDYFEPRPWHEKLPLRPQVWPLDDFNSWKTHFKFDFADA
jgi:catechol 2,3-dioxygenase-like lactoylglutathione lyase family enzyme